MKKVLTILACGLLFVGCDDVRLKEYPHKITGGYVKMKLDGREGMVIGIWPYSDMIEVRFATDTHSTTSPLFGGVRDVEVSPYKVINVHEFEVVQIERP